MKRLGKLLGYSVLGSVFAIAVLTTIGHYVMSSPTYEAHAKAAAAQAATDKAALNAQITAALRDVDGRLVTWEVTNHWLVVTMELPDGEEGLQARRVGEAAVLAVRNALHGHSPVDSYRVTVNGPSPGPGLIRRFGSARFHEIDGSVAWEAGLAR
jgi:RNA 3'-terminal phosphate cyclase